MPPVRSDALQDILDAWNAYQDSKDETLRLRRAFLLKVRSSCDSGETTQMEIGALIGFSRQRISQMLGQENM